MDLIGKTTINPFLFYSGKISGYITWIALILLFTNNNYFEIERGKYIIQLYLSYMFTGFALLLILNSLMNLGKSTRLGLPNTDTKLKTSGIYRISRNPMYLGFNLLTISSMIYTSNIIIIALGLYSIVVYHLIIKAEENFLEDRFGNEFIKFKTKTRRYL